MSYVNPYRPSHVVSLRNSFVIEVLTIKVLLIYFQCCSSTAKSIISSMHQQEEGNALLRKIHQAFPNSYTRSNSVQGQFQSSPTTREFGPCVGMTAQKNNRFLVTHVHYKQLAFFLFFYTCILLSLSMGLPFAETIAAQQLDPLPRNSNGSPSVNYHKKWENRIRYCLFFSPVTPTSTHSGIEQYTTN